MKFIKDYEAIPRNGGIRLNNPGQHSFRDDLEPGCRPHDRLQPRPQPHRPAQPFPEQDRNPFGCGPGGYPAGLEQQELHSPKSLVGEEPPGNESRLAGARFGVEH